MENTEEPRIDPMEALDALHELMHRFAPRNHNYIEGTLSSGESATGLVLYFDLTQHCRSSDMHPYHGTFGGVLFGQSDVELQIVEKDQFEVELLQVLEY